MRSFQRRVPQFLNALWLVLTLTGTAFASGNDEQTSLRADAANSVELAFLAVEQAARQNALWIPAKEAADHARAAFERGDYELAIRHARSATRFAALGIRQLDYPPYQHFD
jgi:hypothetical protein